MPAKQDKDILKVAVRYRNMNALLKDMNKKQHLSAIIQEVCMEWSIEDPDQFALKFSEGDRKYITEKNRDQINNGSILELMPSPSKTTQDIITKLSKEGTRKEDLLCALKELSQLSSDITFANEWINKDGAKLIIGHIEGGVYSGEYLAYALQSFLELMEHNVLSWEIISNTFIQKVSFNLTCTMTKDDPKIVQASLAVLENILLNSPDKGGLEVEKSINTIQESLLPHLQSKELQVQQNCLALINALFQKADKRKKKYFARMIDGHLHTISEKIIEPKGLRELGSEMSHQLYVLQSLLLNQLEEQMNTPFDMQNQDELAFIRELRNTVFGDPENQSNQGKSKHTNYVKDYKKLGFDNDNPALDLMETPPGMLAMDNMRYFARNRQEDYTKIVLENCNRDDKHGFPFGRSSIELTKLLCEILKIGQPPSEEGEGVHAVFFSTRQSFFQEMFCVGISTASKTWKEMEAALEDFPKVFLVVKEQLTRALDEKPATILALKDVLKNFTYTDILRFRKDAITNKEISELKAKPIMELRERVIPEIKDLIRQQRLGYLVDGTRFNCYNDKGQRQKNAFTFWKLSPNHKVLHHGETREKTSVLLEELPLKLPIVDIKELLTGRDCPPFKDGKAKKISPDLAFTIVREQGGDLKYEFFVAPDQQTFDYWTDGINALLGHEMTSQKAKEDLEILLNMDIKLRLLDIEGIDIPQEPPPIPKDLPPNFDFHYDLK